MSIWEEIVLYEITAGIVAYGAIAAFHIWQSRPKIGWDPEQLRWRAARAIYRERKWH